VYFDGTNDFLEASAVLHHTGAIDAFLRLSNLTGTQTIYSRNYDNYSAEGSENFVRFQVEAITGFLTFRLDNGESIL
jgi:hypothetical protein